MEDALGKSPASLTDYMPAGKEGRTDDLQKRQATEKEDLRRDGAWTAKRRKDGKKPSSESDRDKSTKSKPAVGRKATQVATDLPANENGWLVSLQTAMKVLSTC